MDMSVHIQYCEIVLQKHNLLYTTKGTQNVYTSFFLVKYSYSISLPAMITGSVGEWTSAVPKKTELLNVIWTIAGNRSSSSEASCHC